MNELDISKPLSVSELKRMAVQMRKDILYMIHAAQAGHPGGSLSATDIVTALYFRLMRINPANPHWEDRDRFILSKGHACPVWYAALANRGYFDRAHLATLRKLDSILQGHADMKRTPGVDMTIGSLGQGICVGVGMALAARINQKDYHVWVIIGDGEMQEGSVWEAAMSAAKWKLDNLTVILDLNRIQNDDFVEKTMPLGQVKEKWQAFGWKTICLDGHDMQQVVDSLERARTILGVPTILIADTIKGKGVSFMENVPLWHGTAPNDAQYAQAVAEVESALEVAV